MRSRAILVVILAIAAVSIVGPAAAPVAAQQANATATGTPGASSLVAQVDERIRVTEHTYDAEAEIYTVTLENTGEAISEVTITEVIASESAGSRTFGIEQVDVSPGEEVAVEVSVARTHGAAGVMITTELSVEQGTGVYLQESKPATKAQLIGGGASGGDVRMAGLTGILATICLTALGAWIYVSNKHESTRLVDLSEADSLRAILKRRAK